MRGWTAIIVAVLMLVAGCASTSGPSETTTEPSTAVESSQSTQTPTRVLNDNTERETTTITTPEIDNPWGREPVSIGVMSSTDSNKRYEDQVRKAIEYWENNGSKYAEWGPVFVFKPNESNPDILVEFVDRIDSCGFQVIVGSSFLGCATVLDSDVRPNYPEVIEIRSGLSNNSTYNIVRHELGHTLGLSHGDEPKAVMNETTAVTQQHYAVYLDLSSAPDAGQDRMKSQARHAFNYYENGADGWLDEKVTFELADDEESADWTIEVTKDSPPGSIGNYSERTIYLDGLPPNRHGWHIGYWFGFILGAESIDGLPPAFDQPRSDDRTDWW